MLKKTFMNTNNPHDATSQEAAKLADIRSAIVLLASDLSAYSYIFPRPHVLAGR